MISPKRLVQPAAHPHTGRETHESGRTIFGMNAGGFCYVPSIQDPPTQTSKAAGLLCPVHVDCVEEPPVVAAALWICSAVSGADSLPLCLMWRGSAQGGG